MSERKYKLYERILDNLEEAKKNASKVQDNELQNKILDLQVSIQLKRSYRYYKENHGE